MNQENFLSFKKEFQEIAKKHNYKWVALMIEQLEPAVKQDRVGFEWWITIAATFEEKDGITEVEAIGLLNVIQHFEKWIGIAVKQKVMSAIAKQMFLENVDQEEKVKWIAKAIVAWREKTFLKNTNWSVNEDPIGAFLSALFRNR